MLRLQAFYLNGLIQFFLTVRVELQIEKMYTKNYSKSKYIWNIILVT